jgi:hypothetical protein
MKNRPSNGFERLRKAVILTPKSTEQVFGIVQEPYGTTKKPTNDLYRR